jgi:hypothetical protein
MCEALVQSPAPHTKKIIYMCIKIIWSEWQAKDKTYELTWCPDSLFFFGGVLGLELRPSHLLFICSTSCAMPPVLLTVLYYWTKSP